MSIIISTYSEGLCLAQSHHLTLRDRQLIFQSDRELLFLPPNRPFSTLEFTSQRLQQDPSNQSLQFPCLKNVNFKYLIKRQTVKRLLIIKYTSLHVFLEQSSILIYTADCQPMLPQCLHQQTANHYPLSADGCIAHYQISTVKNRGHD